MKKMNRFALLTLVGGILASALVMGCGGGDAETTDAGTANGANATTGNAAGGTGNATNAPAAP